MSKTTTRCTLWVLGLALFGAAAAQGQTPGDVNGDHVVNAVDVQIIVNATLGVPYPPGVTFSALDTNADGAVNAVDVQTVVNGTLGIVPPPPPPDAGPVAPVASFFASPRSGQMPLTVQFAHQMVPGAGPIAEWYWEFGDGATNTVANPMHTYARPGQYTVSLTVSNEAGSDTAVKTKYIVVSVDPLGPSADFMVSPRSGSAPLEVQFSDQSDAGTEAITAWQWDFGDGTTSTAANPVHTYANPGTYDVALTVTTAVGSDSVTRTDHVTVGPAPVGARAAFSASPRNGHAPLAVTFTDQSTSDAAPVTAWRWDLGDGSIVTQQHPRHTYAEPGVYTVQLTVASADGSHTETKSEYIVVTPAPVGPQAAFSALPAAGTPPLTVQFADETVAGSAPLTSWNWEFGDGQRSTASNPTHTYTEPGLYTVSLTVTTDVGTDTETKTGYISVSTAPVGPTAAFFASPRTGTAPLDVQFADQSQAGSSAITAWQWDFGDGTTSTVANPSHRYAAAGTYAVALTVTTADGSHTTTKSGYITVSAQVEAEDPSASFTMSPSAGAAPLQVQFTDTSSPGSSAVTGWQWDFGDGATSTSQHPSHTYTAEGTYSVSLTVTTAVNSNTATRTNAVTVSPEPVGPEASFVLSPSAGAAPLQVQFTDTSLSGSSAVTGWLWDFGDGATSTSQHPSHTYTAEGTYNVSLTVTTDVDSDTAARTNAVTVSPEPVGPEASFVLSPSAGAAPLQVQFTDTSSAGSSAVTGWLWDFGDGATSTSQHPSHTYTAEGTYTVSLTVTTDVDSDTATQTNAVTVDPAPEGPEASFTLSPSSGAAPLQVQFTDTSSPGSSAVTGWLWDFGDGNTSTSQHPSHTYTAEGTYTVSLTVTTDVDSDTATQTNAVTVDLAPVTALSGTVWYDAGPVAGAQVTVHTADWAETLGTASTDASGAYALEVDAAAAEPGLRITAFGGTVGGAVFNENLAALYGPADDPAQANLTPVTTLVVELTDAAAGKSTAWQGQRDGAVAALGALGLLDADAWHAVADAHFDWAPLAGSIEALGGIEAWVQAMADDVADSDVSAALASGFPLAHGGVTAVAAGFTVVDGEVLDVTLTVTASTAPAAGFGFALTSGPAGLDVTADGRVRTTGALTPGSHGFTVRVTNSDTGGYRDVEGTVQVLAATTLAQGTADAPGAFLASAWHDAVLDIPAGLVNAPAAFKLIQAETPSGARVYSVHRGPVPAKSTADARARLYLDTPVLGALADGAVAADTGRHLWGQPAMARFSASGPARGFRLPADAAAVPVVPSPIEGASSTGDAVALSAETGVAAVLESLCGSEADYASSAWAGAVPVLLVHGWTEGNGLGGGPQVWGGLAEALRDQGYAVFEFRYRSNARIQDVAGDLAAAVYTVAETTGQNVHIVAHSLGGLVARAYVQGLADGGYLGGVAQLITVGTPHSGLFPAAGTHHGVAFPKGLDDRAQVPGTQLSLHQAGLNALAADSAAAVAERHQISVEPGEIVAQLADFGAHPLPVPVTSLIGLTASAQPDARYDAGDGFVQFEGQRFHPALSCGSSGCVAQAVSASALTTVNGQATGAPVTEVPLGYPTGAVPGQAVAADFASHGGYRHGLASGHGRFGEAQVPVDAADVHHTYLAVTTLLAAHGNESADTQPVTFEARVLDAGTGLPIAGARMVLLVDGTPQSGARTTGTGGTATLTAPFRASTSYTVAVGAGGYRAAVLDPDVATGESVPGSALDLGDLYLHAESAPAHGVLEGVVTDVETGMPLQGVSCVAANGVYPYAATTDADGRYRFDALPQGEFTLRLGTTGYLSETTWATVLGGTVTTADAALFPEVPEPLAEKSVTLPGGVALELVWVPAGTYMQGSPAEEQDRWDREGPQREVTLTSGFWMSKYEVTKGQWQALMSTAPWTGRADALADPNSPAVYIDWNGANAFALALQVLTGNAYRLPTEAEWEYASRAGTTTRFYWGDDPTYRLIDAYAWHSGNAWNAGEAYAHVVGQKRPNAWGLYDMSGNVFEWCSDYYGTYSAGPVTNPAGPATGTTRVIRGGAWFVGAWNARSAYRYASPADNIHYNIGFRVVLPAASPN